MARFKRVALAELVVDDAYQRPLDKGRVRRIVKNFDPAMLGALEVSRHNGKCAVFDGQHRLAVLRELGWNSAPCFVHEKLSRAQEASLFYRLQRDRKPIHPVQAFKARRAAGDPIALEIAGIVEAHGCGIGTISRDGDRDIAAVTTLERIYRCGNLDATMRLLALWDGDSGAHEASFMDGVSLLEQRYGHRIGDRERDALAAVSAVLLVRNAMSRQVKTRGWANARNRGEEVFVELRKVAGLRGAPRNALSRAQGTG